MYYLQSRYYDPETSRFLNADAFTSTGQGLLGNNIFAYCNNNPANFHDSTGLCKNTFCIYFKVDCKQTNCPTSVAYNVVDITEKLDAAMKENSEALKNHLEKNNYIESTSYFIDQVKPGGAWDFKSQTDWALDENTKYLYEDTVLRYDDIGNIHYGYVGRVLFSTEMLLKAGGLVQIYAGTSSWSFISSNFDDPQDQWAIQFGCNLWDMEAVS